MKMRKDIEQELILEQKYQAKYSLLKPLMSLILL